MHWIKNETFEWKAEYKMQIRELKKITKTKFLAFRDTFEVFTSCL